MMVPGALHVNGVVFAPGKSPPNFSASPLASATKRRRRALARDAGDRFNIRSARSARKVAAPACPPARPTGRTRDAELLDLFKLVHAEDAERIAPVGARLQRDAARGVHHVYARGGGRGMGTSSLSLLHAPLCGSRWSSPPCEWDRPWDQSTCGAACCTASARWWR
jgi:hypothetical protein